MEKLQFNIQPDDLKNWLKEYLKNNEQILKDLFGIADEVIVEGVRYGIPDIHGDMFIKTEDAEFEIIEPKQIGNGEDRVSKND